MEDSIEAMHQQAEIVTELYPNDGKTEPGPTTSELVDQQRQSDRELPERMVQLIERAQEKTREFKEQAETAAADQEARRWSDADLRDLTIYQQAQFRQQATAQQFQSKYQAALREHGVSSFEELQQKAPKVALMFKDEFAGVVQGAQLIQQASERIQANLTVREVQAARTKLFREIPALADDTKRGEFIAWAAKEAGVTPEEVMGVRDAGLIRTYWAAFAAIQRAAPKRDLKIPKVQKADTAPRKSAVDPRIADTKFGKRALGIERLYGAPARRSTMPKKLPRRDPAAILYGEA